MYLFFGYSQLKNMLKSFISNKKEYWEILFVILLFIFLWAYLFIRANTVFYVHDEIVTKWSYMVSWNPQPYHGYIDANNHFLNSFFGGIFIRLFQSDSMWIVRFANLLAFPLFYWSIFGLRNFFRKRINFYWLLISLTCSAFIIEFFGMARGYGISIALMVFAIQQTLVFFKKVKINHFIASIFAWILAVYANLTLIPIALLGLTYLGFFLWKENLRKWIMAIILLVFPLGYAIKYSFYLKQIGKLYLGGQDGFIKITLHSLTKYLWNVENLLFDSLLLILTLLILFTIIWDLLKSKNFYEAKIVFSLFFIFGLCNILLQNYLLGINFPEDRAAVYLVIFFLGGLCFTIDYWRIGKLAFPFILLNLVLFGFHFNLKKFIIFDYEHFDIELLTKLPDQVKGIPPSTGDPRSWAMVSDELTRLNNLPLRAMQLANLPSDTLEDYIITREQSRPDIFNLYHPIHKDEISQLTLFERNYFLSRTKIKETFLQIDGANEYNNLYNEDLGKALFLRCSGFLEEMNIHKNAILIFCAEDSISDNNIYYQVVDLTKSCFIEESGIINFDFTFAMNEYIEANQIKVYLWNNKKIKLKGGIKLEVYEIS